MKKKYPQLVKNIKVPEYRAELEKQQKQVSEEIRQLRNQIENDKQTLGKKYVEESIEYANYRYADLGRLDKRMDILKQLQKFVGKE